MITFEELNDLPDGPYSAFVRETFGQNRRGSVESLNFHNNTVSVYFWEPDVQVDIHLKGLILDMPSFF